MNEAERQEAHNQEVAARESGRNDSGTAAGASGVQQHEANNPTPQPGTGGTGGSCFPSDTPVLTPQGWEKISQLNIGDEVMSLNKLGQIQSKIIMRLKKYKPSHILTVHTDGKSFDVTGSHSVMTQRGWLSVAQLQTGDVISQIDEHHKTNSYVITSIEDDNCVEPVFNIIVSGNYTFITQGCVAHSFTYFKTLRIIFHKVFYWSVEKKSEIRSELSSLEDTY